MVRIQNRNVGHDLDPTLFDTLIVFLMNDFFSKFYFIYVYFVALRPKSTAMVMAGQSVHLTTLFPGHA